MGLYDFAGPNEEYYVFVCHIADFIYNMETGYDDVQSAWFALASPPTLVDMTDISAVPGNRRVSVQWETAAEIDNAGFNVYRAEARDGEYVQINKSLIAPQGSVSQGAAYQLVDTDVQNRRSYWYVVEDVDSEAVATPHGPVQATPRLIYGR